MIDQEKIKQAVRLLLEGIGEDPSREGLVETERIARMRMRRFTGGLPKTRVCIWRRPLQRNIVKWCQKKILLFIRPVNIICSCFTERHIAYIPDGRVVGLSKLARTVEVYARRPQIQEQLTGQIADALETYLEPKGVMVMIEAEHMCMTMRGIKKP